MRRPLAMLSRRPEIMRASIIYDDASFDCQKECTKSTDEDVQEQ
jgi:hypothetical protein